MKKHFYTPFFLLLILSCAQMKKKQPSNFVSIEITFSNGWTEGKSIKIDSSGKIIECVYHYDSIQKCYADTLTLSQLDTIITKLEELHKNRIDSFYNGSCADCGEYHINIVFPHDTIKSTIIGFHKFNNDISMFSEYISNIKVRKHRVDTVYHFVTGKFVWPKKLNSK